MPNKSLSYEQLNPSCYVKQLCDRFTECKGQIIIPGDEDRVLHYEIDPRDGDFILRQQDSVIRLTPCDIKKLIEILTKLYSDNPHEKS